METHDQVKRAALLYMNKYKHQHINTWQSVNNKIEILHLGRMETWGYMTKYENQHSNTWLIKNSMMVIHEQVRIATQVPMTKWEINACIHDQGWISTGKFMMMWKYQHRDTRPCVNINMGHIIKWDINRRSMNKCKYQHRDTWTKESIKAWYMTKC